MLCVVSNNLKIAKIGVDYDFSSTQINFPDDLANKIKKWCQKNISDSDVYTEGKKYGRENEIHITVKYGLHTKKVDDIIDIVKNFGKVNIQLGKISRFIPKDKDYEVVKIDIESEEIHKLNKIISKLPNTDEHPVYRPHCTLAYVKKGTNHDLSGLDDFVGIGFVAREVEFSSSDGTKTQISLI